MELKNLFSPRIFSELKKATTNYNTDFLKEYFNKPIINELSKDRAKKISESVEALKEPEILYEYDEAWNPIKGAEITSEYTTLPKEWESYSKLLSSQEKVQTRDVRDFLLKRLSLSKEQASGIAGVLFTVTKLNPKYSSANGEGIGNWKGPDKERIKDILKSTIGEDKGEIVNYTLHELLEALAVDLKNHSETIKLLKKATTVDDSADIATRGIFNGEMSGLVVSKKWIDKNTENSYDSTMYGKDDSTVGNTIAARVIYTLK